MPLAGNSLIFIESNQLWNMKRKVLSSAFYKDKLIKMSELIIREAKKSAAEWKNIYANSDKEINIIGET